MTLRQIARALRARVAGQDAGPGGALTEQEVQWAYRILLDRHADAREVSEMLGRFGSVRALRRELLRSPQFKDKRVANLYVPALSGNEGPLSIERVEGAENLERMFDHIQRNWKRLGASEPHWSVITADEFKSSQIQGTRTAFYESGRGDAQRLSRTLERNGVDIASLKTCLDYGCGVGRVSRWLAESFAEVYACDISSEHLALARESLAEAGIRNVQTILLRRILDVTELPGVDLVHSIIVLQHNPPPVMAFLLAHLLRILKPGGVAYFQVPTYRAGYAFSSRDYLALADAQDMEMHVLPQPLVFAIVAGEGCRVLEVLEDHWTGCLPGDRSNTFLVRKE